MGYSKYLAKNERNVFLNPERKKQLLLELSEKPEIYRIERPTRLFRAHALGYKAKQGYFVVRARISKGLTRRERPNHARHPSKTGLFFGYDISKKEILARRILNKYPNAIILGGYYLVENGQYKWYEFILKDRSIKD
ncbi:MAG: 50S ribosomal protein L15 [Candidatus Rehaiarchaeum fermentans]|nr:50S ribosomal protein L15 [Candidatus Rehaiarchaeum fermentans]MCW1292557.1 50S ribosomal protein L15 [Candidatus Rehaiarchaeum fermentans]MCW1293226.1 50S ribosomal protein L15 [Candidatus Rehaiarchaeum fermentans]MCW1311645.1 50S ribosomal protein L15 [Candidatus Rehaiarchaeum fermentans]